MGAKFRIIEQRPKTVMHVNTEEYCQPCFSGGQTPFTWWCNPWKQGDYQFGKQDACDCIKNSIKKPTDVEPKYGFRDDTWPFNCDPIQCAKSDKCSCFSKIVCGKTICYQRPCCRYRLKHPFYRLPDNLGMRFHVPRRVFNPPKKSKPPIPFCKCPVHCPKPPQCTCCASCQCSLRRSSQRSGSRNHDSCFSSRIKLGGYHSLDLFASRESSLTEFLESQFPCPTKLINRRSCHEKSHRPVLKSCQEIINERQIQQQNNTPTLETERNLNPFVKYRKLWLIENEASGGGRYPCQLCYYVNEVSRFSTSPTKIPNEIEQSSETTPEASSENCSGGLQSSENPKEGRKPQKKWKQTPESKILQILYSTTDKYSTSLICSSRSDTTQEQCSYELTELGTGQICSETSTVSSKSTLNQPQLIRPTVMSPSGSATYNEHEPANPPSVPDTSPNQNIINANPAGALSDVGNTSPDQNIINANPADALHLPNTSPHQNVHNANPDYVASSNIPNTIPEQYGNAGNVSEAPNYAYVPLEQMEYCNGYYYPNIPEQPQYYLPCYPTEPECPNPPCDCESPDVTCYCRRPKTRYNSRVLRYRPCENCPDTHFELDSYIRGLQALITTYDPFLSPFSPMRKKLYAQVQRIPPKLLSARKRFSITGRCMCIPPESSTPYSRGRPVGFTCRCTKPKRTIDLIEEMRRWQETWTGRKMDLCPNPKTCKCKSLSGCS